jgi:hypothetical protein
MKPREIIVDRSYADDLGNVRRVDTMGFDGRINYTPITHVHHSGCRKANEQRGCTLDVFAKWAKREVKK